jgi:hypothetical protein
LLVDQHHSVFVGGVAVPNNDLTKFADVRNNLFVFRNVFSLQRLDRFIRSQVSFIVNGLIIEILIVVFKRIDLRRCMLVLRATFILLNLLLNFFQSSPIINSRLVFVVEDTHFSCLFKQTLINLIL